MAKRKRSGIPQFLLGTLSLILSGYLALEEYEQLHSGGWADNMFESQMWTIVVIFGVLGIAGIVYGLFIWTRKG